jgi:hypothetical protein
MVAQLKKYKGKEDTASSDSKRKGDLYYKANIRIYIGVKEIKRKYKGMTLGIYRVAKGGRI